MSVVLGVDTGGTFTDFVLVDHANGTITTTKVPSTPRDPGQALAAGLARLEGAHRVDRLIIATTVATNAVLERQGPRVVLVTNRDFEDVLFIGRMDKERIYDLNWRKPKPLVNCRDCLGIGGRFDAHGRELLPLASDEMEQLEQRLAAYAGQDVSVAICCLFSYLNGDHERRAAAAVPRCSRRLMSLSRMRSRHSGGSMNGRAPPWRTRSSSRWSAATSSAWAAFSTPLVGAALESPGLQRRLSQIGTGSQATRPAAHLGPRRRRHGRTTLR